MQASPLNRQMKYEPYALVGKGEPGNFTRGEGYVLHSSVRREQDIQKFGQDILVPRLAEDSLESCVREDVRICRAIPGNFRMRGCNPAGGGYRAIPEGTGDVEVMNYQRKRGFW